MYNFVEILKLDFRFSLSSGHQHHCMVRRVRARLLTTSDIVFFFSRETAASPRNSKALSLSAFKNCQFLTTHTYRNRSPEIGDLPTYLIPYLTYIIP